MSIKKKLFLAEHLNCNRKQYEVVRIEDSVHFSIGEILTEPAVNTLIHGRQWLVKVIGAAKGMIPLSPSIPMTEPVLERSVPIFYLSDNDFGIQGLPTPSEVLFNNMLHELREMYDRRWEADFQSAYGTAKVQMHFQELMQDCGKHKKERVEE